MHLVDLRSDELCLLHFICILLPLFCCTLLVLFAILMYNSSDPKDKFSFYALKFLLYLYL